jgi:hypothetical protein
MVIELSTVRPAVGEILGVTLPGGGSVVIEQAASSADGRYRVGITITLPNGADLQLRVNGELLLLGDE